MLGLPNNVVYAMVALVMTLSFGIWFATENGKTERNYMNWGIAMAVMVASGIAFMVFGYNGMRNIRGTGNAMPANVAPAAANMPSNIAGSVNAQQPATI
jgi:hypothetical protein